MRKLSSSMRELCLGAVVATLAIPASAQPPPEEIIVTGRYGPGPDSVRSLSMPVSYSDLDISTAKGWDMLRQRVKLTARFLCEKLGESDTSAMPSCRNAAVSSAMGRVLTAREHAAPRDTTWVAPRPWVPPYPPDWATKYP